MWEEKSFLSSRFAFSSEKHAIRHCHTKKHEVESDVNNFSSLPVYEWLLRLKWIPHNSSNKCSSDKQAILDRQQFENLLSELVLFISGQLSNFRAWMNLILCLLITIVAHLTERIAMLRKLFQQRKLNIFHLSCAWRHQDVVWCEFLMSFDLKLRQFLTFPLHGSIENHVKISTNPARSLAKPSSV